MPDPVWGDPVPGQPGVVTGDAKVVAGSGLVPGNAPRVVGSIGWYTKPDEPNSWYYTFPAGYAPAGGYQVVPSAPVGGGSSSVGGIPGGVSSAITSGINSSGGGGYGGYADSIAQQNEAMRNSLAAGIADTSMSSQGIATGGGDAFSAYSSPDVGATPDFKGFDTPSFSDRFGDQSWSSAFDTGSGTDYSTSNWNDPFTSNWGGFSSQAKNPTPDWGSLYSDVGQQLASLNPLSGYGLANGPDYAGGVFNADTGKYDPWGGNNPPYQAYDNPWDNLGGFSSVAKNLPPYDQASLYYGIQSQLDALGMQPTSPNDINYGKAFSGGFDPYFGSVGGTGGMQFDPTFNMMYFGGKGDYFDPSSYQGATGYGAPVQSDYGSAYDAIMKASGQQTYSSGASPWESLTGRSYYNGDTGKYDPTFGSFFFDSPSNDYRTFQQPASQWQTSVPQNDPNIINAIYKAAGDTGLAPEALAALAMQESNFDPREVTRGNYGVYQMSRDMWDRNYGGLSFDDYINAGAPEQIAAYADWLNRSNNLNKGSGGIQDVDPTMQAAMLQAIQFGPNKMGWRNALDVGNMSVPVASNPYEQAKNLRPTSLDAMYSAYDQMMSPWRWNY